MELIAGNDSTIAVIKLSFGTNVIVLFLITAAGTDAFCNPGIVNPSIPACENLNIVRLQLFTASFPLAIRFHHRLSIRPDLCARICFGCSSRNLAESKKGKRTLLGVEISLGLQSIADMAGHHRNLRV